MLVAQGTPILLDVQAMQFIQNPISSFAEQATKSHNLIPSLSSKLLSTNECQTELLLSSEGLHAYARMKPKAPPSGGRDLTRAGLLT